MKYREMIGKNEFTLSSEFKHLELFNFFDCGEKSPLKIGRGDRIRTCDPLVPNQMRYQTALLPDRPSDAKMRRIEILRLFCQC